jgi:D-sedoheptulose 7-phosphate isomerase
MSNARATDGRAELLKARIQESLDIREALLNDDRLARAVDAIVEAVVASLRSGGKILLCGNGGSAADAQHLAAELVGRFLLEREPMPAIALADNVAALTAISNDYSYSEAYARVLRAFGKPGDVLIGFSTSGASRNVIEALTAANALDITTVAFLGQPGSAMERVASLALNVPATTTASIQEVHKLLGHVVFELAESELCSS